MPDHGNSSLPTEWSKGNASCGFVMSQQQE
jgi:hypothetical protein